MNPCEPFFDPFYFNNNANKYYSAGHSPVELNSKSSINFNNNKSWPNPRLDIEINSLPPIRDYNKVNKILDGSKPLTLEPAAYDAKGKNELNHILNHNNEANYMADESNLNHINNNNNNYINHYPPYYMNSHNPNNELNNSSMTNNLNPVQSLPILYNTLRPATLVRYHSQNNNLNLWKPFRCEMCFQRFGRAHDLKRHHNIHLNFKPYHCNQCDKQFSRLDALKRHQNTKKCKLNSALKKLS